MVRIIVPGLHMLTALRIGQRLMLMLELMLVLTSIISNHLLHSMCTNLIEKLQKKKSHTIQMVPTLFHIYDDHFIKGGISEKQEKKLTIDYMVHLHDGVKGKQYLRFYDLRRLYFLHAKGKGLSREASDANTLPFMKTVDLGLLNPGGGLF